VEFFSRGDMLDFVHGVILFGEQVVVNQPRREPAFLAVDHATSVWDPGRDA